MIYYSKEKLMQEMQKNLKAPTYNNEELYKDLRWQFNISLGHGEDFHVGQHQTDLLKRMYDEDKNAVSTFSNTSEIAGKIQTTLLRFVPQVAEWAVNGDTNKKICTCIFKSKMGYGYRREGDMLAKCDSNAIKVVFERAKSQKEKNECPYGFYIKSIYAPIDNDKYVIGTPERKTPYEMVNDGVSFGCSKLETTAIIYRQYQTEDISITPKKDSHAYYGNYESLNVSFKATNSRGEPGYLSMYLSEEGPSFRFKTKEDRKYKLNREAVSELFPHEAALFFAVQRTYEKIRDGVVLISPDKEIKLAEEKIQIGRESVIEFDKEKDQMIKDTHTEEAR